MKGLILLLTILSAITVNAQIVIDGREVPSDSLETHMMNRENADSDLPPPKDPYPIYGHVYKYREDSKVADTIFIDGCLVQILANEEVITSGETNTEGFYSVEFPVKWFSDHDIFISIKCDNYEPLKSGPKILYGFSYPASGMQSDYGLEKKK